jgi:hypothetical protein
MDHNGDAGDVDHAVYHVHIAFAGGNGADTMGE